MVTERESALLTDLYQLNMDPGLSGPWRDRDRGVRVFRPEPAAAARLFASRRGSSKRSIFSRTSRFSGAEIEWLRAPAVSAKLARLSRGLSFLRRRPRHARRHGVLRQRADPAHHRADAAGAVRRIAPDQSVAFSSLIAAKAARVMLAAPGKTLSISACGGRTAPKPG